MPSPLGRLLLAITERRTVRRLITTSRPGRTIARRFVAGETLDEAATVARRLNDEGFSVSLDYLGEAVEDPKLADAARSSYLECLERISRDSLDANISVKLTQLGLGIDDELAGKALRDLVMRAGELGTSVTVDMEGSPFTQRTVDLVASLLHDHQNVGIALQAYLFRTQGDLERLAPLGGHIRLCKGAYKEPADLAYTKRREVDANFDRLSEALMGEEATVPAIATHDATRIGLAAALAARRSGPWEFQMLYGVRRHLQRHLLSVGHSLRVYVPYGSSWYPYLTRRLAERPANLWFFLRALFSRD